MNTEKIKFAVQLGTFMCVLSLLAWKFEKMIEDQLPNRRNECNHESISFKTEILHCKNGSMFLKSDGRRIMINDYEEMMTNACWAKENKLEYIVHYENEAIVLNNDELIALCHV